MPAFVRACPPEHIVFFEPVQVVPYASLRDPFFCQITGSDVRIAQYRKKDLPGTLSPEKPKEESDHQAKRPWKRRQLGDHEVEALFKPKETKTGMTPEYLEKTMALKPPAWPGMSMCPGAKPQLKTY